MPKPFTNSSIIIGDEKIKWYDITQDTPSRLRYMHSFDIVHKRDLGDQYLNVHSRAFTQLFGYNNNIQYKKRLENIENGKDNDVEQMNEQDKSDFRIGMGHVLSGIRAHMSENVISAPLAAYLTMEDTRFRFSHDVSRIFVTQILECYFYNENPVFQLKTGKDDNGNSVKWPHIF